jgi:hypothetical protein
MRLDVLVDPLEIAVAVRRMTRHRDDLAALRKHARTVRFIQRGKDLSHGQIAGTAEENEGEAGVGLHVSPLKVRGL